jgi:hypothetical protein
MAFVNTEIVQKKKVQVNIIIPLDLTVIESIDHYENKDQPRIEVAIAETFDRGQLEKDVEIIMRNILLENGFDTSKMHCGSWANIKVASAFSTPNW